MDDVQFAIHCGWMSGIGLPISWHPAGDGNGFAKVCNAALFLLWWNQFVLTCFLFCLCSVFEILTSRWSKRIEKKHHLLERRLFVRTETAAAKWGCSFSGLHKIHGGDLSHAVKRLFAWMIGLLHFFLSFSLLSFSLRCLRQTFYFYRVTASRGRKKTI